MILRVIQITVKSLIFVGLSHAGFFFCPQQNLEKKNLLRPNNMQFFFVGLWNMTKMKGCFAFSKIFWWTSSSWRPITFFSRFLETIMWIERSFLLSSIHPLPKASCDITKILKIRKCLETIETIFPLDWGTMCSYGKVLAIVEKPLNLPFGQRSAEDLARPRMKKPCPKKNTSRMFPARPPSRSLLMHLLKS